MSRLSDVMEMDYRGVVDFFATADDRSALERRQDEIEAAQEQAEHEEFHRVWRDSRDEWERDEWAA